MKKKRHVIWMILFVILGLIVIRLIARRRTTVVQVTRPCRFHEHVPGLQASRGMDALSTVLLPFLLTLDFVVLRACYHTQLFHDLVRLGAMFFK